MSTQSLIQPVAKKDARERFDRLAADWKEKAKHLSNSAQIALLPSYQRIIGMGWDAVPFIIEELQSEPNQWFCVLESITEENPVPREALGKVRAMAQAWIEWGRQNGVIVP